MRSEDNLYRCLDKLLEHRQKLFVHLRKRWEDMFEAKFEVLLYDLTSTYFESSPPFAPEDKRQYGYSRDKRFDCVQVVIALVVTPEGFPLAYEVMAGNTSDKTTLRGFLVYNDNYFSSLTTITNLRKSHFSFLTQPMLTLSYRLG